MAAPTVRQIRAGAKTALDTISGLRVFDYVPGQFSPPAAIVGIPSRVETETMIRGTDRWELPIWVVVGRQADAQSEKAIEVYLNPTGSTSIRAAMIADTTLGGVVNDVAERPPVNPATFQFVDDGPTYLTLEFTFTFLAPGKD